MLYTLNRDMIAQQQAQSRQLSEYADSLAARNTQLNHQLQKLIQQTDAKVQGDFQQREQEITVMRERSFHMIGGITGFVIILLMLSYIVIHRNTKRIHRYKEETTGLIAQLQKALDENNQLLSARRKAMFTIIHELRTPLTFFAILAQDRKKTGGERMEYRCFSLTCTCKSIEKGGRLWQDLSERPRYCMGRTLSALKKI